MYVCVRSLGKIDFIERTCCSTNTIIICRRSHWLFIVISANTKTRTQTPYHHQRGYHRHHRHHQRHRWNRRNRWNRRYPDDPGIIIPAWTLDTWILFTYINWLHSIIPYQAQPNPSPSPLPLVTHCAHHIHSCLFAVAIVVEIVYNFITISITWGACRDGEEGRHEDDGIWMPGIPE